MTRVYNTNSFFSNGSQFTCVETVYDYKERDKFIKKMNNLGLTYRIKKHESGFNGSYKLYKEVK